MGYNLEANRAVEISIEDLPDGYAGVLFIVSPDFKTGIYQPMNELIAPSSTAYGGTHETIWAFVWPMARQHVCCGWFSFDCLPDRIIPDNADVSPDHQRRGIASSVYRFVERLTGVELVPSSVQTDAAARLWKSLIASQNEIQPKNRR